MFVKTHEKHQYVHRIISYGFLYEISFFKSVHMNLKIKKKPCTCIKRTVLIILGSFGLRLKVLLVSKITGVSM